MAVSGSYTESYGPRGTIRTYKVGATPVVAGNLVEFSASKTVIPAQDESTKVAGLAGQSGSATGDVIDVLEPDGYFAVVASAAISAGDVVCAAAAGKVKKWSGNSTDPQTILGRAEEDIAQDATGIVRFF